MTDCQHCEEEPAMLTWGDGLRVCVGCFQFLDNYEPPAPTLADSQPSLAEQCRQAWRQREGR